MLSICACSSEKRISKSVQSKLDSNLNSMKEISMLDADTGWALTTENEVFHTENGVEQFQRVHKVETADAITDYFVDACFLNESSMYLAYFSSGNVVLESTTDAGKNWNQSIISYQQYGSAYQVFVSFVDEKNGYILCCSEPGGGLMNKILFQTQDGGYNFEVVSDLTNIITGYPTGISFSDIAHGYVATTYHGEDNCLFSSSDSGVTWKNLLVEKYDEIKDVSYLEGYPPVFWGEEKKDGILIVKYVGTEKNSYVAYRTKDRGVNWSVYELVECKSIRNYSFRDETVGYIVDEEGNAFYVK